MLLLSTGFEAMKTGDAVVYERFFQQQSDVCMLRLFDSFTESAPQLVFHIFVIIHKSYVLDMPVERLAWTAISAIASLVSKTVATIRFHKICKLASLIIVTSLL
jgi:hypothetical protein